MLQTHSDTATSNALVVEGGAMRGIFAAGVLDAFLEKRHQPFTEAWGVSAGSTNLIGYLCGHHGRNHRVITDHACRPEFINWGRFFQGGHAWVFLATRKRSCQQNVMPREMMDGGLRFANT